MRPALPLMLLSAVASVSLAGTGQDRWLYRKEIAGPAEPGYYTLQLDPEVLASARSDLGDLRVVSQSGKEQPYSLGIERDEAGVEAVSARMYNLSRVPGRGTRFQLDMGSAGRRTTEITIETPGHDFRYQVTVEGSADEREWAVLRSDGAIFDFTGDVTARSTLVRLPETDFRYLRLTIHDPDARPLSVIGVSTRRDVARPVERVELKQVSQAVTSNSQHNTTQITVDLGLPGQPFDRVELQFGDLNVRRQCSVGVTDDPEYGWRPSGSGAVFRYDTATFMGVQTLFSIPEARGRYVRVTIPNGDNEPIHPTGVRLWAVPRRVVFERKAGSGLWLYYGNETAPTRQYEDFETYLRLQRVVPRAGATLGPQEDGTGYKAAPPPWSETRPWLLWGAVAIAALVLGFMIVRVMRSVGGEEGA
jgi:hypothetical protein